MKPEEPIRAEDVRRAAAEVRACPVREQLSALSFDVLSRQAEGRTLFAGKEHVDGLAETHGVVHGEAEVSGVNVLSVLERGPRGAREHALVAALAVDGFSRAFDSAPADERDRMRQRFVHHADFFEVETPYVIYGLVDALLGDEGKKAVFEGVADAVIDEARGASAPRHDGRARNAARLSALAASASASARAALSRVATEAEDVVVRRLAAELGGDAGTDLPATRLSGRPGPPRRGTARTLLRLVTGIAALSWLLRFVGRLVGVRREAEVELVPGGLVLRTRIELLGRTVREREERFTMAALAGVAREVRYPMLHLVVGLLALSVGILLGGLLAFDALVTGETIILLVAAALILIGGGLDLALDLLVPARAGRVSLDLSLLPARTIRIERVPTDSVDRFVDALRIRASS